MLAGNSRSWNLRNSVQSILESGLICGGVQRRDDDKRAELHLVNHITSGKTKTSGVRVGSTAVIRVDMLQMYNDGIKFQFSEEK